MILKNRVGISLYTYLFSCDLTNESKNKEVT